MRNHAQTEPVALETAPCPYCGRQTTIDLPDNYAPVYTDCDVCATKFITQRLRKGFQVLTLENAPCYSDPDCRELEMGGYDEE